MVAVILIAVILIAGTPALIPFVRRRPAPRLYRWALGLVVANVALQVIFVLGLVLGILRLYYSTYFALVGMPLCVAGGILGIVSLIRYQIGLGSLLAVVSTAILTAVCWFTLVTLH